MSYAETLARALNDGAFGELEGVFLHRARRETSLKEIVGREAIVADDIRLAAEPGLGAIKVERFAGPVLRVATAGAMRQHRWPVQEGDRIARETVVAETSPALLARAPEIGAAAPVQPPLGELRSGRGQLAAGGGAWAQGPHQPVLDALHRIWNGRRFDELAALYAADASWSGPGARSGGRDALRAWLIALAARLPDATLLFDSFAAEGDRLAILWRLFAHEDGARVRAFGSSLMTLRGAMIVADETLFDELAVDAARYRPAQIIRR